MEISVIAMHVRPFHDAGNSGTGSLRTHEPGPVASQTLAAFTATGDEISHMDGRATVYVGVLSQIL